MERTQTEMQSHYEDLYTKVEEEILELQKHLQKQKEEAMSPGNSNWGYLGNLGYVRNNLYDINEQLGS